MDSIGIENLTTRLTFPEHLVKQVTEQIVNEQILFNLNHYLILLLLIFLTSASTSYLTSYFRKRGENFATKSDFQDLLNQVKAQTKITEEVKTAVNHKDWASKERKTLSRIKLEELMSSIYDIYPWHNKKVNDIFKMDQDSLSQNPLYKSRMIIILYFPELLSELDLFTKSVGDFEMWTTRIHEEIAKAKNNNDHEKLLHILESVNTRFYITEIVQAINSIELKSHRIMQDIIRSESPQN
ncbi:hypothetical protein [Methylomicrobium lacus]|uniref:hypothetical protein n=1 Tax=Methylomicrobium lacus TaxID=136992 RepID=UPI00045E8D6D|nr:hypothetical protein [Methylomicrobium lacus]